MVTALSEGQARHHPLRPPPRVVGGRYGLASKELTRPWSRPSSTSCGGSGPEPLHRGHRGRRDTSLEVDSAFVTEGPGAGPGQGGTVRALFYGLGSDGTVGANKNSIKIIGEETGAYAQGYFVYDSKKAGSTTVSHLRFGPRPIRSAYLIDSAGFVACHQWSLLDTFDGLERAEPGAPSS